MRFYMYLFLLFAVPATHAAVCDPNAFQGDYGLLLTGTTTIGGPPRAVVVVGRLALDGYGGLSGVSSAGFTGLILGNPVTGKYEAHTDCSVTWTMQDSSGNLQHFAGLMRADGSRIAFGQTDQGGAGNGTLLRTMNRCSESSLAGLFQLTASGVAVDVITGTTAGRISVRGLLAANGARKLTLASAPDDPPLATGTYDVQDDCFVMLELGLPAQSQGAPAMHFRAILADSGREVLGIQTDPGTVVALRLLSQ